MKKVKKPAYLTTESAIFYQTAINSEPHPIIVIDQNKKILYANKDMAVHSSKKIAGKSIETLLALADLQNLENACKHISQLPENSSVEFKITNLGGLMTTGKYLLSSIWLGQQNLIFIISSAHHVIAPPILEKLNILQAIIENLPVGVTLCSESGTIFYCNPHEAAIHGYEVDELIGQRGQIFAPKDLWKDMAPENYNNSTIWQRISRNVDKNGREFPVMLHSLPIRDQAGNFLSFMTVCEDITEQKKLEDSLRSSEANFRYIVENISDALWIFNVTKGKFVYRSPTVYNLRGYTAEEARNHTLDDIFTPDSKLKFIEVMSLAAQDYLKNRDDSKIYLEHMQLKCKDGGIIWVEASGKFRENEKGELEQIGLTRNINARKKAELALNKSLRDLKLAQQIAKIGNWSFDPETNRLEWSEMVFQIYDRDPELGTPGLEEYKNIYDLKHFETYHAAIIEAIQSGKSFDLQLYLTLSDGKRKWLNSICRPDPKPGPQGHFLRGTIQDITDRKLIELENIKIELRYKHLVENLPDIVWSITDKKTVQYVSSHVEDVLGYKPDELYQQPGLWQQSVHPDDQAKVAKIFDQLILQPKFQTEYRIKDKYGNWHWFRDRSISVINTSEGFNVEVISTDITDNKNAFKRIEQQTGQLRALSRQLSLTEDNERKQIARELHDDVGQKLTALTFTLKLIQNQLPKNLPSQTSHRMDDALQLIDEIGTSIRNILVELRSPVLDDFGLASAIRLYAEKFSVRTGIKVKLNMSNFTSRPKFIIEQTLLRIVQEALTNAAKHASPSMITIHLKSETKKIGLSIIDDGTGFDPDILSNNDQFSHWGILTMKERTESIGGKFYLTSTLNKGTTITVEAPNEY